jgi:HlyD family secretion protein
MEKCRKYSRFKIWRKFAVKQSFVMPAILLVALLFSAACNSNAANEEQTQADNVAQAATLNADAEEKSVPVEVALVETGDISLIFNYSGSLQPKDELNLVPGASGRIDTVLVEEGQAVKEGDPIAVIETERYETAVKQAEAALAAAKLNLAKMEIGSRPEEIAAAQAAVALAKASLNDVANVDDDERTQAASNLARTQSALKRAQSEYDKIAWAGDVGTTPQALALEEATIAYETALAAYNKQVNPSDSQLAPLMLQVAQAELQLALTTEPFRQIDFATAATSIKQAEAALEAAQINLDETIIRAPFDGTLADLNITKGSQVSQQTPIGRFISDELEAQVGVQESRIGQIEAGQSASLQITAFPGQDFPGQVTSVSTAADPSSRTFTVKITPAQGQEFLRSGMFADVSILAQENTNTILAPREAIVQGNQPSVFVVKDDNTVEQRNVTTGLYDQSRIEVIEGLQPGDVVVVAGQPNLQDGFTAEIVNDPRIAD